MEIKSLLQGLHSEVTPGRLLPPAAAVRIFLPLAMANDPTRAQVSDTFKSWILERDQAISVNQVAYLWLNFRTQYGREAQTSWRAWFASKDRSGLTSPVDLARNEGTIFLMTVFKPWADQLRRTLLGRVLLTVLQACAATVVLGLIFLASWVAGAAATELLRVALQALF